ncbi:MAG: putative membrane protein [Paracoccaceae bacterium]
MDQVLYPIIFFVVAGVAAYLIARKMGYITLWAFVVLGVLGYVICAVSLSHASGERAGLAEILIAFFIITPVLVGAVIGSAIGGYRKQRRMLERLNDR